MESLKNVVTDDLVSLLPALLRTSAGGFQGHQNGKCLSIGACIKASLLAITRHTVWFQQNGFNRMVSTDTESAGQCFNAGAKLDPSKSTEVHTNSLCPRVLVNTTSCATTTARASVDGQSRETIVVCNLTMISSIREARAVLGCGSWKRSFWRDAMQESARRRSVVAEVEAIARSGGGGEVVAEVEAIARSGGGGEVVAEVEAIARRHRQQAAEAAEASRLEGEGFRLKVDRSWRML